MKPNRLAWSWPALDLPAASNDYKVSGLVVPYAVLCWLDREGGLDRWKDLNPNPTVSMPPPVALFLQADVILATGRTRAEVGPGDVTGRDPLTAAGTAGDDVLIYGRETYEKLVCDQVGRPEDLKVLVVPLDPETEELHRLAVWVEYLRGSQEGPEESVQGQQFVPPPWAWDRHAGAKD